MKGVWLFALSILVSVSCGGGGDTSAGNSRPEPPAVVCNTVATLDTSKPDSTVGSGAPASCTETVLAAAVANGGIIVFNCGSNPHTISISSELQVNKNTTIDGGGKITLDGQNSSSIINKSPGYELIVQNINLYNGKTSDRGAAIFADWGGRVVRSMSISPITSVRQTVLISAAVRSMPSARPKRTISGCIFSNNAGSNGGASAAWAVICKSIIPLSPVMRQQVKMPGVIRAAESAAPFISMVLI